jgi:hypothetical protein
MKYVYITAEFDKKMAEIFNIDYVPSEPVRIPINKVKSIMPSNIGIDIGAVGKDPWNKGKTTGPLSESHRKSLSIAAKKYKRTPEHQENNRLARSESWSVTNPKGETFIIKSMNHFCKCNQLRAGSMTLVSQGKRKQHKGWTCSKIL